MLKALAIVHVVLMPVLSFAWGRKGHSLVAEVAFHYLSEPTKKEVLKYLDGMTIEEAANWMDEVRGDHAYDNLKPLHYVNIEKGQDFNPSSDRNIVAELNKVLADLQDVRKLSDEDAKKDLLILFHLVGDLHQPLHAGYGADKGGNSVQVYFNEKGTNIHSVWDTQIIEAKNISIDDCLAQNKFSKVELETIKKPDVIAWMKDSRSLLDKCYDFKGNKIDDGYVNANYTLIEKQILKAGIRLAAVLENDFASVTKDPVFKHEAEKVQEIPAESAAQYEGKLVKVCAKVANVKYVDNGGHPTYISLGANFPNQLLTVLIWGDGRETFKNKPETLDGKDICVTGKIVMYKGKPEIIVSKEEEIAVK